MAETGHTRELSKWKWHRSEMPLRAIIEVGDEDEGENIAGGAMEGRKADIMEILGGIVDPVSADSIVAAGMVDNVQLRPSASDSGTETVDVKITLTIADDGAVSTFNDEVKNLCILQLSMLEWIGDISVSFGDEDNRNRSGTAGENDVEQAQEISLGMKGVKRVIAVSSCKGGVGKSTTSVNLAYTLRSKGHKVGILDADIYGPSLPTMTSPVSPDLVSDPVTGFLLPMKCEQDVSLMSMGWINKGAAIMRGPMVNQILNQFVSLCDWGELDYLVIDMPPGTGDIQLTLAQIINVDAAVIVTTPQRLSFVDVVKGIDMFDTVNIPCVAVVENMAQIDAYTFEPDFFTQLASQVTAEAEKTSSDEGSMEKLLREAIEAQNKPTRLFGKGHIRRMVNMWGIESVFSLPVMESLSRAGDSGHPFVVSHPDSVVAREMLSLADSVESEIEKMEDQQQTINYDAQQNLLHYSGKLGGGKDGPLRDVEVTVTPFDLRCDCRCALCIEEMTGKQLLDVLSVDPNVKPVNMAPIGRYAMSVDWSDGHKSLYPFKQIAALAEKFQEVNQ